MVTTKDISNGVKLRPVQEHCRRIFGKRVAPSTIWRWIKVGVKGGKLEAVNVGGKWLCSDEAFANFINSQTEANIEPEKRKNDSVSNEQLRAAGLL